MKYNQLGTSGLMISQAGLGTMTFGKQVDQKEADRIVNYAFDAGINYFDTADIYEQGRSEELLGNSIKAIRHQIILASKVGLPVGTEPNEKGLSRRRILNSVEESLKRLQTDYLDIYYLHSPDPATSLEETLETMDDLVKQGKIIYYAVSNYAAWQVGEMRHLAEKWGLKAPVATQNVYNLLTRDIERELLPYVSEKKQGLIVYNPLAGGLLSGKYSDIHSSQKNTRFSIKENYKDRYWNKANFEAVQTLEEAAKQENTTLLSLAIRWLAENPLVSSTIIGVSCLEQLKQNLAIFEESELSEELKRICDKVWDEINNHRFQYNR
ncbi:MAG: aldo/keto reductase [Lachnospiraceae bacterium]|nr:aldo/keto reductase [Lachnospiraceae bacterium]